ncbi:unnamed protein product, partial [marine sediment metagenome]
LLQFLEPNSIVNVSKNTGILLNTVSIIVYKKDRDSCLLNQSLIELVEVKDKSNLYKITEKGIKHLQTIYDSYQQKQEQQEKIAYEHLETKQVIEKFKTFFEDRLELLSKINDENKFIIIDFKDIIFHSPELGEQLLDSPDETIKKAELGLESLSEEYKDIQIRILNIPKTEKYSIGEIRHKNIGKLIKVVGSVVSLSDVRPHVVYAKFECPSCGNIINIIQTEQK